MLDSNPLPLAIAAVVAIVLLILFLKFLKGAVKGCALLVLMVAIVGGIAWMKFGGSLPF